MLAPSLVEADRSLLAARALGPLIAAHRDAIEEQRRLPAPLVEALVEADLFRLWVPREVGGAEASLETLLRVVEEVSKHDGAVGWNLAIGASGALVSGWLDAETLREVFGSPASIVAGSFNVRGKAAGVRTPGGYQVSGQWGFGSGCQQAKWLGGAGAVVENGAPRMLPDGVTPEPFMFLFPQAKAELLDTWKVMGMRGTGSQDYRVNALAIPEGHAIPLARPPRQSGPLYRIPLVTLLGLALAPNLASGSPGPRSTCSSSSPERRSRRWRRTCSASGTRCRRRSRRPRGWCARRGRSCSTRSARSGAR